MIPNQLPASFVDPSVAASTEQGEVDEDCRPAVDPVPQVVAIRPAGRAITSRELAVPVSQNQRLAHWSRNHPRGPAHAQNLEAAIVHELVERYLAGESLIGLARDLNRRQVPTVTGSRWRVTTVRGLLGSPRLAGLREYQGQLLASPWPAIIDADQYHRLRASLQANAKAHRRAARSYLLTGIVCCGREGCGQPLVGRTIKSTSTHRSEPRYVCAKERGGCGGISILALPVEERVTEALFEVMDSPEFARRLRSEDGQPPEIQDEVEKVERRFIPQPDCACRRLARCTSRRAGHRRLARPTSPWRLGAAW